MCKRYTIFPKVNSCKWSLHELRFLLHFCPDPCRSKGKVIKVLHYWVHQNLNFISTHNDKIETHIAKFCTTGAWQVSSLKRFFFSLLLRLRKFVERYITKILLAFQCCCWHAWHLLTFSFFINENQCDQIDFFQTPSILAQNVKKRQG